MKKKFSIKKPQFEGCKWSLLSGLL